MTRKSLKMFVWDNVLTDYTSGIICVLAHDEKEARELLSKVPGWESREDYTSVFVTETQSKKPKVFDTPGVAYCWGGG